MRSWPEGGIIRWRSWRGDVQRWRVGGGSGGEVERGEGGSEAAKGNTMHVIWSPRGRTRIESHVYMAHWACINSPSWDGIPSGAITSIYGIDLGTYAE